MAQVKLLKIHTDGVPVEGSQTDEITFASFTVSGGGPVLDGTGLDMNSTEVKDVLNLLFNDPTTAYINQSAGNLIIDDIMAKDRENVMTVSGAILFPTVSDSADQIDAFRLPTIAGAPTAAPADGGEGYLVWDSTNDKLYAWNGTSWDDLSTVQSAENIDDDYTAEEALSARDVVYISSADSVSKAQADTLVKSKALGFAIAGASAAAQVFVRKFGRLAGFSGMTPGARQYLSPATAGAITETLPVGTGNTICMVGYAKSATELDIMIQQLGRRA